MKTFTWYEVGNYTIYVDDATKKVHHAVDETARNSVTLYPYEPSKYGGLDNACDMYTLRQVKNRLKNGKICFR